MKILLFFIVLFFIVVALFSCTNGDGIGPNPNRKLPEKIDTAKAVPQVDSLPLDTIRLY